MPGGLGVPEPNPRVPTRGTVLAAPCQQATPPQPLRLAAAKPAASPCSPPLLHPLAAPHFLCFEIFTSVDGFSPLISSELIFLLALERGARRALLGSGLPRKLESHLQHQPREQSRAGLGHGRCRSSGRGTDPGPLQNDHLEPSTRWGRAGAPAAIRKLFLTV